PPGRRDRRVGPPRRRRRARACAPRRGREPRLPPGPRAGPARPSARRLADARGGLRAHVPLTRSGTILTRTRTPTGRRDVGRGTSASLCRLGPRKAANIRYPHTWTADMSASVCSRDDRRFSSNDWLRWDSSPHGPRGPVLHGGSPLRVGWPEGHGAGFGALVQRASWVQAMFG